MVLILFLAFLLTGENVNAKPTQAASRREQQQTASQSPSPLLDNPRPEIDNSANAASSGENKERDAKDNAFKAEQLRQSRVIVRATVWIAIFSGLSFLAVLVYAIVSLLQWREVKKQAGHAEEQVGAMRDQLVEMKGQTSANAIQFETQLAFTQIGILAAEKSAMYANRAYISVAPEVPDDYHYKLIIENSGNTPAYGVEIFANVDIVPKGKSIPFDVGRYHDPLGVIGPRRSDWKVYGVGRSNIGEELIAARKEGSKLYCWGVVKYRDIFDKEGRGTWFCFEKGIGDTTAYPHTEGNNAT